MNKPSHYPWFHLPNNIWWSSSLCSLLQPPAVSSLLGPNIFLSTLFSNTLNLCCYLRVRGQVSHSYKTTAKNIVSCILIFRILDNRDSSVGIALGYGLDDLGSRVRFPAGAANFFHHCVQNGSGAHPASYPMSTRGSFPVGKAAGVRSWPLNPI
jgi:hypothetical protein